MIYKKVVKEGNITYYSLKTPIYLGVSKGNVFNISDKIPTNLSLISNDSIENGIRYLAALEPDIGDTATIYPAVVAKFINTPIPLDIELSTYWNIFGEVESAIQELLYINKRHNNEKF